MQSTASGRCEWAWTHAPARDTVGWGWGVGYGSLPTFPILLPRLQPAGIIKHARVLARKPEKYFSFRQLPGVPSPSPLLGLRLPC